MEIILQTKYGLISFQLKQTQIQNTDADNQSKNYIWCNLCEHGGMPLYYVILCDFSFNFMYLCISKVFNMSMCYNQKKNLNMIFYTRKKEWESKFSHYHHPSRIEKACTNDVGWGKIHCRVTSTKLKESSREGINIQGLVKQNIWANTVSSDIDTMSPSYRLFIHL